MANEKRLILKPCPFCGTELIGREELWRLSDERLAKKQMVYTHPRRHCVLDYHRFHFYAHAEQVDAWNKRVEIDKIKNAPTVDADENFIYKAAFEIAVRCARELNGTPELKEAYQEAQKDNRALRSFMDFCLQKAAEETLEQNAVEIKTGIAFTTPVFEKIMRSYSEDMRQGHQK